MKRTLIILLIIAFSPCNAMKRKEPTQDIFRYDLLLKEIQDIVIDFCTIYTVAKTPKDATLRVHALSHTKKTFHTKINDLKFSDNLINIFASKFYCSHETIARYLNTKAAQERLSIQLKLKNSIENSFWIPNFRFHLQQLQQEDINFNFTYNYVTPYLSSMPKTVLMILISLESCTQRHKIFEWLLENKANINATNSHGLTALHFTSEHLRPLDYYNKILTHSDVKINQQNKYGENPLLYCLLKKKKDQINYPVITALENMLKAGADPYMHNKYGIHAFSVVKRLKDERLNSLFLPYIKQNQAKK